MYFYLAFALNHVPMITAIVISQKTKKKNDNSNSETVNSKKQHSNHNLNNDFHLQLKPHHTHQCHSQPTYSPKIKKLN